MSGARSIDVWQARSYSHLLRICQPQVTPRQLLINLISSLLFQEDIETKHNSELPTYV